MEPENGPLEKENNLTNLHFGGQSIIPILAG